GPGRKRARIERVRLRGFEHDGADEQRVRHAGRVGLEADEERVALNAAEPGALVVERRPAEEERPPRRVGLLGLAAEALDADVPRGVRYLGIAVVRERVGVEAGAGRADEADVAEEVGAVVFGAVASARARECRGAIDELDGALEERLLRVRAVGTALARQDRAAVALDEADG